MKKLILLILVITIFGCKELPGPDILTGNKPLEITITKPQKSSIYENHQQMSINWNFNQKVCNKINIQLVQYDVPIKKIATVLSSTGKYLWTINNVQMQENYRIRITIADGIYTGKSFDSEEFGVRTPWQDLGFISKENAWGSSVCSDNSSNIYVALQDDLFNIKVMKYNQTSWEDLLIESQDSADPTNFFSTALSKEQNLMIAYTQTMDLTIIKRWDLEQKIWQSYPYLTHGQAAFGLSLAKNNDNIPEIAFNTLIQNFKIPDIINISNFDPWGQLSEFNIYLMSRKGIDNSILDSDPWEYKEFWVEMGKTDTCENCDKDFGTAVYELDNEYWKQRIALPSLFDNFNFTPDMLDMNIGDILKNDLDLLFSLQSDFYTSLAIGKDDTSYIAFINGSLTNRNPYVIKSTQDNWELVKGPIPISQKYCSTVSLILDNDNRPVIAYKEMLSEPQIKVKIYSESQWIDLNFPGKASESHPSLVCSSEGKIYLAAGRSVWTYESNQWKIIGIPVTNGAGFHPEWLSVTTESVCVAYVDFNHNNKIHVKKLTLP